VILLQLFWLCFRTSLVSFGGVYGALPELQRVFVVQHGWLSSEQLIQDYVIGQLVPGPNMVVCTLLGLRIAGIPGALAASLGTYLAPILLISAAAKAFHRYYRVVWVRRTEVALRPLAFGFMASAVVTILREQLSAHALATLVVAGLSAVLYGRRIVGPMVLIAVSGAAFALIVFGLRFG
jgi:chromate transporter